MMPLIDPHVLQVPYVAYSHSFQRQLNKVHNDHNYRRDKNAMIRIRPRTVHGIFH